VRTSRRVRFMMRFACRACMYECRESIDRRLCVE
jgi:hypothetical protein